MAGGKSFLGLVVGTAMQRTIKVRVANVKMHPIVQKVRSWHGILGWDHKRWLGYINADFIL
jgi:hypothetical protein